MAQMQYKPTDEKLRTLDPSSSPQNVRRNPFFLTVVFGVYLSKVIFTYIYMNSSNEHKWPRVKEVHENFKDIDKVFDIV